MFQWLKKQKLAFVEAKILRETPTIPRGPQIPRDPATRLGQFERMASVVWEEMLGDEPARLGSMLDLPDSNPPFSEWHAYHQLLLAAPNLRNELFIGLDDGRPRLVPRSILEGHGYILGGTGSGKTAIAVSQLLIQLAIGRGGDDALPPIIIFDLKPEGDRILRGVAEQLARLRNQKLAFFSNRTGYQSLTYDPLRALTASQPNEKAIAQTLVEALMPTHSDRPDDNFFLNEGRMLLESIIGAHRVGPNAFPSRSFRDIINRAGQLSRGHKGNREARGIHGALSDFLDIPHVRIDPVPDNIAAEDLDFSRILTGRQIAYVHLDSGSLAQASRTIGRLMLWCLLAEAKDRVEKGRPLSDFYVFIDEFHEIASTNVGNLLTTARSAKARIVMSHQTTASLPSPNMTKVLMQNTALQMLLSPDDKDVLDAFDRAAGEVVTVEKGGGESVAFANGKSNSDTFNTSVNSRDTTQSVGGADSSSTGLTEGFNQTWKERRSSALTPDMISDLDSKPRTALVRVRKQGEGSTATTPWRGIPLLQLLYPLTSEEKTQIEHMLWPREAPPPPAIKSNPTTQRLKNAKPIPVLSPASTPTPTPPPLPDAAEQDPVTSLDLIGIAAKLAQRDNHQQKPKAKAKAAKQLKKPSKVEPPKAKAPTAMKKPKRQKPR